MQLVGVADRVPAPVVVEVREHLPPLTVAAVEPVSAIHDRRPLILPPDRWDAWLDPAATVAELLPLLASPPAGLLEAVQGRAGGQQCRERRAGVPEFDRVTAVRDSTSPAAADGELESLGLEVLARGLSWRSAVSSATSPGTSPC